MLRTTIPFQATELTDWINQLHKELQNQTDLLVFKDQIEGIEIDLTTEPASFGIPPKKNIDWKNCFALEILEESAANQLLLSALMQGASCLLLSSNKDNCNWDKVLEHIEVEYIDCFICLTDISELKQFEYKSLASKRSAIEFLFKKGEQINYFSVFDLQQIGAKISTQLSTLLLDIHRELEVGKIKSKYFFELGVGSNYFLELSKIRALRHLISRLEAIHKIQINYELITKTGFSNKSLKDPYTNLLRQATEALCAIIGGSDVLCLQAYDSLSQEGPDDFSRRMALNIGNLIQEEVQLKSSNDPLKNSRVVEAITSEIVEHAWTTLLQMDEMNEIDNITFIKSQIEETRLQRIGQLKLGAHLMIGINQFENSFETKVKSWANSPIVYGFPYLIYELV
jgi:methylmalonyl-CoA mutase